MILSSDEVESGRSTLSDVNHENGFVGPPIQSLYQKRYTVHERAFVFQLYFFFFLSLSIHTKKPHTHTGEYTHIIPL